MGETILSLPSRWQQCSTCVSLARMRANAFYLMRMILGAGAVWESESIWTVHGAVDAKRALRGQSGRRVGVWAENHAVHRHRSAGRVIEGSAGIVDGRSRGMLGWSARGGLLGERRRRRRRWRPAGVRLVQTMLQQPRDVLHRSAAVLVGSAEMVIVHVTGVILESTGVLYRAHHTVIYAASPHGAGRHGRRGRGMIDD